MSLIAPLLLPTCCPCAARAVHGYCEPWKAAAVTTWQLWSTSSGLTCASALCLSVYSALTHPLRLCGALCAQVQDINWYIFALRPCSVPAKGSSFPFPFPAPPTNICSIFQRSSRPPALPSPLQLARTRCGDRSTMLSSCMPPLPYDLPSQVSPFPHAHA